MKADNHTKLAAVAAVLVGLFAVIAVNKYIQSKTKVTPTPKASILVAKMEVKEGGELGEEMFDIAEIPFEALSNMHISLPSRDDPSFSKAYADVQAKLVGRKAKRIISANSPIFWIDVETEPKPPFAGLIGEGNRAITMPVDVTSSVNGFIRPGSRVDIALTATESSMGLVTGVRTESDIVVTSVIMQNVPVIACGTDYDLESEVGSYGTITLNLPTKAALMLIQARSMGKITYLLRNVRDTKTEADRNRLTVAPGSSFGDAVRSL